MTEVGDRLERHLMSLGVYVERHAVEGGESDAERTDAERTAAAETNVEAPEEPSETSTLHLEYETAAGGLTQGNIGNVCSELVEAHREGWEPRDVHCWVFDTDGGFHGEWEARAGWFRALDNGDISETDFSTLVLSTRQPADEPPAPVPGFADDSASSPPSEADSGPSSR